MNLWSKSPPPVEYHSFREGFSNKNNACHQNCYRALTRLWMASMVNLGLLNVFSFVAVLTLWHPSSICKLNVFKQNISLLELFLDYSELNMRIHRHTFILRIYLKVAWLQRKISKFFAMYHTWGECSSKPGHSWKQTERIQCQKSSTVPYCTSWAFRKKVRSKHKPADTFRKNLSRRPQLLLRVLQRL